MLVLGHSVVLLLVFTATAIPNGYNRDIFGLIHANTNTTTSETDTRTLITATSSLGKQATSTSQAVPSQWTPATTSQPNSTTAINATPTVTPSVASASAESQPTDHSSKTWQIIGIAIIAILFIATSITCAMFFDRLWRFLRDVVCCTSHPITSEEFLPHSETQSWDLSSSPLGSSNYKNEDELRVRELPWNIDTQDWATLHRQPSRRNDLPQPNHRSKPSS